MAIEKIINLLLIFYGAFLIILLTISLFTGSTYAEQIVVDNLYQIMAP